MLKENSALATVTQTLTQKISNINDAETPIIQFVNELLREAVSHEVSDIHCEPYEKNYRIRFRIDGILYVVVKLPITLSNRITSRFKVMAKLDISEKRLPQDGRFTVEIFQKHIIHCRINTCPVIAGEKIVIRLLDPASYLFEIEKLGFTDTQRDIFLSAIRQPQGMILVTGPTGSGKTFTLYTAINLLNSTEKNISTIENPVEIYLEGINQIEVNSKIGMTFSNTLRALLRQDPDIMLVGEMRDQETAETGMQAAQTGHLILSTLHTNNAAESLMRLMNLGISAFDITTSISLIISQRLARRLCEQCKTIENSDGSFISYQATGCTACSQGYKGRVGIFEILPMTEQIKTLILSGKNTIQIAMLAKKNGWLTLQEAALEKIQSGITSVAEVNRVIKNNS